MRSIWQDVRFGVRRLGKSPFFTSAATLILALGIGANTAVFSLINALFLRTLPVNDAHLRLRHGRLGYDTEPARRATKIDPMVALRYE